MQPGDRAAPVACGFIRTLPAHLEFVGETAAQPGHRYLASGERTDGRPRGGALWAIPKIEGLVSCSAPLDGDGRGRCAGYGESADASTIAATTGHDQLHAVVGIDPASRNRLPDQVAAYIHTAEELLADVQRGTFGVTGHQIHQLRTRRAVQQSDHTRRERSGEARSTGTTETGASRRCTTGGEYVLTRCTHIDGGGAVTTEGAHITVVRSGNADHVGTRTGRRHIPHHVHVHRAVGGGATVEDTCGA